ncbi:MAG: hypothetical protein ACRDG4_01615, partial [Chloroflexota bacterium]
MAILLGVGVAVALHRRGEAPDAALSLSIHADRQAIYPGEVVSYVIALGVRGRTAARDVTIRVHLPTNGAYLLNSTTQDGRVVPDRRGEGVLREGLLVPAVASGKSVNLAFKVLVVPSASAGDYFMVSVTALPSGASYPTIAFVSD